MTDTLRDLLRFTDEQKQELRRRMMTDTLRDRIDGQCEWCGSVLVDGETISDGCPYGTACECGGCICEGAC